MAGRIDIHATARLQGPDLRLLRHADRLGERHDRGAAAAGGKVGAALTRNEVLEAHARHESSQQLQTPAKRYSELLAIVYKRLAEEWGVPAAMGRMPRLWQSVGRLAGLRGFRRGAAIPEAHYRLVILSNVDNGVSPSPTGSSGGFRRDLSPPRTSAPTSRAAQLRLHAGEARAGCGSGRATYCMSPRACSTTTRRPTRPASPPAGSIAATPKRASARR